MQSDDAAIKGADRPSSSPDGVGMRSGGECRGTLGGDGDREDGARALNSNPNAPIKVCTFMGMEVWADPTMPRDQIKLFMAMEPAAKFNGMRLEYYRKQLTLVTVVNVGAPVQPSTSPTPEPTSAAATPPQTESQPPE